MASTKQNRKAKSKQGKKTKRMPEAEVADKYHLYQESVQVPEEDVAFFNRVYKSEFGESPRILREDFCGTYLACCEWVKCHPDNFAYGVDLDPEPIAWGTKNNRSTLNEKQQSRIEIIEGNALDGGTPPADIVTALNFSYYCFKERQQLLDYFRAAYRNIKDDGLFVIDMEGGWEALEDRAEEREEDGFTYTWDQEAFNPINHHAICHIHFDFDDGSRMEKAFSYDWRIWTMPEVSDLLLEAGFKRADCYWEGWDEEEEEGDGVFTLTQEAENCESWIAYLVAVK